MASLIPNATVIDAMPSTDVEMAPVRQLEAPVVKTSFHSDPFFVTFDAGYDSENPKDWPSRRKWTVTDVLSATGFNRIMVSTIMAPALGTIAAEFNMNPGEAVMALSIYTLATAFGPLVMGPLSEVYGRKPILHTSSVWFLIFNIACGFANSKGLLIASRCLAGFGASSIYALAGGVLGDVWGPEDRGKSLGAYILIPVLGAAVGPIIGGFIVARSSWRWMFWSTSIFQGLMILVCFLAFEETYAPIILKRRAERLRKATGNRQYYTADERLSSDKSLPAILGRSLSRPLRLLAFHPIIQTTAIHSAFYYGVLYIALSTFADVWTTQYGQSLEISGLHYIACALGEMVGSQLGGPLIDLIYKRMLLRRDGQHVPEYRIPIIFPGAFLGPLGLFIYGWAIHHRLSWIVVDVGMFIMTFGMQLAGIATSAYVIDAYPGHTSSATAATQFLRSLTAFSFPLFAPYMYASLGYGWGNSTIAFIALFLGVPAPLFTWKYGAKLRARAQSSF